MTVDNEDLEEILSKIHHELAKHMLAKLQTGEPEAKDLAVIVKFLHDNGIEINALTSQADGVVFSNLVKEAKKSISN